MKKRKKIKYTDGHIGRIKIVDDFLPKPKELVLNRDHQSDSVEFFRNEAAKITS